MGIRLEKNGVILCDIINSPLSGKTLLYEHDLEKGKGGKSGLEN
jgi:hypothetical protein